MPGNEGLAHPVLEAIADGVAVDWEAESSSRAGEEKRLQRMRALEALVQAHRRVLEQSPTSLSVAGLEDVTQALSPRGPAPPPLARWGNLEIRERVGDGGFGEVFRAFDPVLEREVALKLLWPRPQTEEESLRRFLSEARRLARVRHDHVVVVHGAQVSEGRMGIWTDFLDGTTLEDLLRIQGTLSPREAALIGIDLCRALAAVHGAGLVHRDVKANNVMRVEGGRIVLFDFGMASADPKTADPAHLESTGGTPLYMAPEVLKGEPAGASADLYSLGILLYRLVSRRYPVEANTLRAIQRVHEEGKRTPLRAVCPDAPTEFVRIVERAISAAPGERYGDAGALELDLARFVRPAPEPVPWYRRKPVWAAAGAVAGTGVVAALVLLRFLHPDFTVQTTLFRSNDGREEEILAGATVSPGDLLHLRVRSTRDAFFVVLDQDPQGRLTRVYPLGAGTALSPLQGGDVHRIPEDLPDAEQGWEISDQSGDETFVIISAAERLPELEGLLVGIPAPEAPEAPGSPADAELLAALVDSAGTGGGKAVPSVRRRPEGAGQSGALTTLIERAEAERKRGRRVWIERFDLHVAGREP